MRRAAREFAAVLAVAALLATFWALAFAAVIHATVPSAPITIERVRDVCWTDYGYGT